MDWIFSMRQFSFLSLVLVTAFVAACGAPPDRKPPSAKTDSPAAGAPKTGEKTSPDEPLVVLEKDDKSAPPSVVVEKKDAEPSGGSAPPSAIKKDHKFKTAAKKDAPPSEPPLGPRPSIEPTQAPPGAEIVNVLYGTNRKADPSINTSSRTDEAKRKLPYLYTVVPDRLQIGVVEISVPKNRRVGDAPKGGEVGRSDPGLFFLLMTITPDSAHFERVLEKEVSGPSDEAIVFIHGYNVPFADAVFRAAQIKVDLQFKGAMLAFSWPSQGMAIFYPDDERHAESDLTRDALADFLKLAAKSTKVKRIHVIAHSMGNRPTQRALAQLSLDGQASKLGEIVFAAPDVNTQSNWFVKEVAPRFKDIGNRRTLYSSPQDMALLFSSIFHFGKRRLGEDFRESEGLGDLHLVDASVADASLLGHSYYGSVPTVIDDVKGVLAGRSPEERSLVLVNRDKNQWTFKITQPWRYVLYMYLFPALGLILGICIGRWWRWRSRV
jgi:esterase/lipase superfamily enzyme